MVRPITAGELEIMLFDLLRREPLYKRLTGVRIVPSGYPSGGWTAEVKGIFDVEERRVIDAAVDHLQKSYPSMQV